ncbi:MAG: hypothetical protein JNG84_10265 [Archangium sp.]|nr:hypothetical protein [Archangium sp.]
MRGPLTVLLLWASAATAGVQVPVDVGVGPAGYWFYGRLLENRGGVPHFGLTLNVHAVIDKAFIEANRDRIPAKYRGLAAGITEARIGPSIFIPETLIISPKVDGLGGTGMFGVMWAPLGLTLVSTGQGSERDWNQKRGRLTVDANVLLTYLFVYSDFPIIPTTHFFRPGIELKTELTFNLTRTALLSLGGGAQLYLPQRLGDWLSFGPIGDAMWLSFFAFAKFHVRFPYDVNL